MYLCNKLKHMAFSNYAETAIRNKVNTTEYSAEWGVVSRKAQQSTYTNLRFWVSPKDEGDFTLNIFKLHNYIRRSVYRHTCELFDNLIVERNIVDCDSTTCDKYLRVSGKSSTFLGVEIDLFFTGEIDIRKDAELCLKHKELIRLVMTDIYANKWFTITKHRVKLPVKLKKKKITLADLQHA